jgi:hypothetical protein
VGGRGQNTTQALKSVNTRAIAFIFRKGEFIMFSPKKKYAYTKKPQ